jgi:hypothetical protein
MCAALIVANSFLETDLEKLRAAVSMGYARGKLFDEARTLRGAGRADIEQTGRQFRF